MTHFTRIMLDHKVTASELCEAIRRTELKGRMVGDARLWDDWEVSRLVDRVMEIRIEVMPQERPMFVYHGDRL